MKEEKKSTTGNIVIRKIRRFFRRLFKRIVLFFKKLKYSFMKLKKSVRYIIYIWVTVFLVFVLFLIGTSSNNKFLSTYKEIEEVVTKAGLAYAEESSVYPTVNRPDKISIDLLLEREYLLENDIKNESCKGYVEIYYNDESKDYVVKPFINCKKYTTKGYER